MRCPQAWPLCAQALSEAELMAVLLEGSPNPATATELSRDGFSPEALTVRDAALTKRRWFAEAVVKSTAAFELARRHAWAKVTDGPVLDRMQVVADYLCQQYARSYQEILGALYLDGKHHLIGGEELFRGTCSSAVVESRVILLGALRHHALELIVFHNHPGGDPTPSMEDLDFSRRLKTAAAAIGIRLVEHLVVAGHRWVSIRARGGLK